MSEPSNPSNYYKKSNESLHKNSSTDTEYSAQPYKFVKQSSNETSTSLTGSFNVDQASIGAGAVGSDPPLDNTDTSESALNRTVIENQEYDSTKNTNGSRIDSFDTDAAPVPLSRCIEPSTTTAPRPLKKQFSLDQGLKVPIIGGQAILAAVEGGLAPPLLTKTATPCASPLSRGFHYLRESSSTSTEDAKDDQSGQPNTATAIDIKLQKPERTADDESDNDNRFGETTC